MSQSAMSAGEAWDAQQRENRLVAMAEAGQKLAVQWGHPPWSDSWARQVAETLDNAAANANHWVCECGGANGLHEAFCYRCVRARSQRAHRLRGIAGSSEPDAGQQARSTQRRDEARSSRRVGGAGCLIPT